MAKNTVTSFGLGNRIPAKPVKEEPLEEIRTEPAPRYIAPSAPASQVPNDDDDMIFPEVEKVENKTKRVQLIIRPSVYKKIHKYLKARNQSFNDFICQYLEAFIEKKGL